MKSVTVRQAQHNLAGILHEVEAGEVVEILRRKLPVARIVPITHPAGEDGSVEWAGHGDRMASIWRGACIAMVDSVMNDLRGGR